MNDQSEKLSPLETALIEALNALDNQIAREMQRDPKSREEQGVQKWQPYQNRIEKICSFLLNSLGEQKIDLDGIIVLTQAFSKTLSFVSADLGQDGLGTLRTQYIKSTFENVVRDAEDAKRHLNSEPLLS